METYSFETLIYHFIGQVDQIIDSHDILLIFKKPLKLHSEQVFRDKTIKISWFSYFILNILDNTI